MRTVVQGKDLIKGGIYFDVDDFDGTALQFEGFDEDGGLEFIEVKPPVGYMSYLKVGDIVPFEPGEAFYLPTPDDLKTLLTQNQES